MYIANKLRSLFSSQRISGTLKVSIEFVRPLKMRGTMINRTKIKNLN